MEYSEKFLVFARYLELNEDEYDKIEEISDLEFEHNRDTYRILDDNELGQEIENQIKYEIEATQEAIDRADLSNLDISYYWNMYLSVDEGTITDNINGKFEDFIGSGTYEEFEGYYIFLM